MSDIVADSVQAVEDFLGLGTSFFSNSQDIFGKWTFSQIHTEIQRRIDDVLGQGFLRTNDYLHSHWYGKTSDWSGDWQNHKIVVNGLQFIDLGIHSDWLPQNKYGWVNTATALSFIDAFDILHHANVQAVILQYGGWKFNDGMHYADADSCMQGIFKEVTQGGYLPNIPLTDIKDTYKAYSYPSLKVLSQYGNNFKFFIRCAPKSVSCQLIGRDISLKQVIQYLEIMGSVAATIITGGSALPLVLSQIPNVEKLFTSLKNGVSKNQSSKVINDLTKISNGADIIGVKGTDINSIKSFANQFIQKNQSQIFQPVSNDNQTTNGDDSQFTDNTESATPLDTSDSGEYDTGTDYDSTLDYNS